MTQSIIKKSSPLCISALLCVCLACLCACGSPSANVPAMDAARNIMEENPDSALKIIEGIDTLRITTAKGKARYALLKSMALDKTCTDLTNFAVLQPALDYYLKKGNPDEQLQTLYYQGRIFQNAGDFDNAMLCFLKASEIEGVTDSVCLARNLVAQGNMYFLQYKSSPFIESSLAASGIFKRHNLPYQELLSLIKALDGTVTLNSKTRADSILNVCNAIVGEYPEYADEMIIPRLSLTFNLGSEEEIEKALRTVDTSKIPSEEFLTLAYGYVKARDGASAMKWIEKAAAESDFQDSIKFSALKSEALELLGDYQGALDYHKDFVTRLENFHDNLFYGDLLFAEKKHSLELREFNAEKRTIVSIAAGIGVALILALAVLFTYYLYYRSKTRRIMAEKDLSAMKLLQMKTAAENDKLELENRNSELTLQKQHLEIENLKLERERILTEKENLESLLRSQGRLHPDFIKIVKQRLQTINSLFETELSCQSFTDFKPLKKLIDEIRADRAGFLSFTHHTFSLSHPAFIRYLDNHNLTDEEKNLACLYALGLKGKEIGNMMDIRSPYKISGSIRRKLGLESGDTNLDLFLRNILEQS